MLLGRQSISCSLLGRDENGRVYVAPIGHVQ